MSTKYVRCDSHCKYPAYDKEEVDTLFKNVYKKEDYAVIVHNIPVEGVGESQTSFSGSDIIDFPEGFTKENSCVVGLMCRELRDSEPISAFHTPYYWIGSDSGYYLVDQITVHLNNDFGTTEEEKNKILIYAHYRGASVSSVDMKLILMKVE